MGLVKSRMDLAMAPAAPESQAVHRPLGSCLKWVASRVFLRGS